MDFLNPKQLNVRNMDEKTSTVMKKTVDFFEHMGIEQIKEEDERGDWYPSYMDFIKESGAYATLLTPTGYGREDNRFDLAKVCDYSELTAFYGLSYQYAYQVSILGLSPIWMSNNEIAKQRAGTALDQGGIFAFGMSEKEHGADLYSNEMKLEKQTDGTYLANGSKYYIGNANEAALISVFGRMKETDEFVFFLVQPDNPAYELNKKIKTSGVRPAYVGEFTLKDYPITEEDILSTGREAWDASLSTVNIGKFQLGFASAGICQHAFYESLNHAANRELYGMKVTDFDHVQDLFIENYCRIHAMRMFATRAVDYFRHSSETDRRYLLFNPIQKMKVTTEGMHVIDKLLDVVAAKGFEQNTFMEMAIRDIGMIPRLEGTSHVNMALVIKFVENYFFHDEDYPSVPVMNQPGDDTNLFNQTTGKLREVKFPHYLKSYEGIDLDNVSIFKEQITALRSFLKDAPPDEKQLKDRTWMLHLGELFTLTVYGQLVLESASLHDYDDLITDQIFRYLVQDFSEYALRHLSKFQNHSQQEKWLGKMIHQPENDENREQWIWQKQILPMKDLY